MKHGYFQNERRQICHEEMEPVPGVQVPVPEEV